VCQIKQGYTVRCHTSVQCHGYSCFKESDASCHGPNLQSMASDAEEKKGTCSTTSDLDNDMVSPLSEAERRQVSKDLSPSVSFKTLETAALQSDLIANLKKDAAARPRSSLDSAPVRKRDSENPPSPEYRSKSPMVDYVAKSKRSSRDGTIASRAFKAASEAARKKETSRRRFYKFIAGGAAVLSIIAVIIILLVVLVFNNDDAGSELASVSTLFVVTSPASSSLIRTGMSEILDVRSEQIEVEQVRSAGVVSRIAEYLITVTDSSGRDFIENLRDLTQVGDLRLSQDLQISRIFVPSASADFVVCPVGNAGSGCQSCASGYILKDGKCMSSASHAPSITPLPTVPPSPAPTSTPTVTPTNTPTGPPTLNPTAAPTQMPTMLPTQAPTAVSTEAPTMAPTPAPTEAPTMAPTPAPTEAPTMAPTPAPTEAPTMAPTPAPTEAPSMAPTPAPTEAPTMAPTPTASSPSPSEVSLDGS